MDKTIARDIRNRARIRVWMRAYLPGVYLWWEKRNIERSQWLTEREKEDKVWLLEHTIGEVPKRAWTPLLVLAVVLLVLVAVGLLAGCQPQTVIVERTVKVTSQPPAPADSLASTYLGRVKHVDIYRFTDPETGHVCYLALAVGTREMGMGCPGVGGGR